MGLEERVNKIEEAILIMKNLLVNHDERLEDYYKALRESREEFELNLRESREDFNFKMNALIDAQIKNEAEIGELKEASRSQLNRIERLENE
jgi:hypothetical protein